MNALQPTIPAQIARPSVRRRLVGHGIGAFLALAYWGIAAAMIVVVAIFFVIFNGGGPVIPLLWAVLCVCAYGLGLLLCAVGGLLTIPRATHRIAIGFLVGSTVANAGLVALVALLAVAVKFVWLFTD